MDYLFSFGPIKKIYRLDEQGLHVCKQSGADVTPTQTIAWDQILTAGEASTKGPAFETGQKIATAMTDTLPQPSSNDFTSTQVMLQKNTGYVLLACTAEKSNKKKVLNLPINIAEPIREAFLKDLSTHLGNRWLGEGQDPSELKKQIGIPLFYQIKGTVIFVLLMLAFAALIYLLFIF